MTITGDKAVARGEVRELGGDGSEPWASGRFRAKRLCIASDRGRGGPLGHALGEETE